MKVYCKRCDTMPDVDLETNDGTCPHCQRKGGLLHLPKGATIESIGHVEQLKRNVEMDTYAEKVAKLLESFAINDEDRAQICIFVAGAYMKNALGISHDKRVALFREFDKFMLENTDAPAS
jgi:hypothetical protein